MAITFAGGSAINGHTVINLRCPVCHQRGTFEPLPVQDVVNDKGLTFVLRRCPDPACRALLFGVVLAGKLEMSFPPQRVDFDATDVPASVTAALEEAISCHAHGCPIAAAIMVRKTLEVLCEHQGAEGKTLKDRLRALGQKVILPPELIASLDDLRLLGNDAAHVESQVFGQVGATEVETSIAFTKEVLKALFQYKALLSRLQALKRPPAV